MGIFSGRRCLVLGELLLGHSIFPSHYKQAQPSFLSLAHNLTVRPCLHCQHIELWTLL